MSLSYGLTTWAAKLPFLHMNHVLIILGFALKGLGFRWVITLGAIAYFLRFADFAWTTPETKNLAFIGIALHGFCFAFFFAAAFLYIDRAAPKDARHSAQTAFGIAILGIGPILSGFFNGWLDGVGGAGESMSESGWITLQWREILSTVGVEFAQETTNYSAIWWTLAIVGAFAALLMCIAFTDDSDRSSSSSTAD